MEQQIIMSGMRTTGRLHIGHYWGVINNWLKLQDEYLCFFAAADWHGLTTHYQDPANIKQYSRDMIIDWLSCGVDPNKAVLFIQSQVPEHAELHLLLSMLTPLSWLQRIPSYKDQKQKLAAKDLSTYGFLGYPLLQTADILIYGAQFVPVGADQASHIELSREIARRFNWLYGTDIATRQKVTDLLSKIKPETVDAYMHIISNYRENADNQMLKQASELLKSQGNLTRKERDVLVQNIATPYKPILTEPQALLSEIPLMLGTDGQKMSKSYGNTISLRETTDSLHQKILKMPTDPARIKRIDVGDPHKCPVFNLHNLYTPSDSKKWVINGCTTADIGCVDCKKCLIVNIEEHLIPIQQNISDLEQNKDYVDDIIAQGNSIARGVAQQNMSKIKAAMSCIA